ncbi:MAG TPA: hypothetical protein DCR23_05685 [Ruminococcaceae bacterium]|nr:hypothetical protein [Oscillospiraceae bacterium]
MKKSIALLLCVVLILGIIPFSVFAENNSIWSYRVISEEQKTAEITGYNGNFTEIVIPSEIDGYTVTAIGRKSFYYRREITSIKFSNTINQICDEAFFACSNLENFVLPNNIKIISAKAFAGTKISKVVIPESCEYIGENAFMCPNLETVIITGNCTLNSTSFSNGLDPQAEFILYGNSVYYEYIEELFGWNYVSIDGILPGDISGDGKVSIEDYSALKAFLSGTGAFSVLEELSADVNSDFTIDAFDLFYISKLLNQ